MIQTGQHCHNRETFTLPARGKIDDNATDPMKALEPPHASIFGLQPQRSPRLTRFLAAFLILILPFACRPQNPSKTNPPEPKVQLDLDQIQSRYREALFYSDKAKLVLQYTLNGTPYEEVHPCSTQITRNQSAQFHRFKLEITGNRSTTLARVLDAQSQNLDGQVLGLNQNPVASWDQLNADSIAQHFAFGGDDIPWNETLKPADKNRFLGIAAHLFNGTDSGWLDKANRSETRWVEIDGVRFADVFFKTDWGRVACRIDSHEKTIVGIRLPTELLSEKISSSEAVSGVSLAILFQDLSFSESVATKVKVGPHETLVSKFVKLPEPFPSQAIGKKLEGWGSTDTHGKPFDPAIAIGAAGLYFYGNPALLTREELIEIESLAKAKSFANFAWFFPPTVRDSGTGLNFSRMGLFFDLKGRLLQKIDAGSSCFYLIVNKSGISQFVSKRKTDWLNEISPVLDRVHRGDNVAQEMHQEYSRYYEKYQNALKKHGVNPSLLGLASETQ
ncbi:MAG: hypothetical protein VX438_02690 [Planctomycetota bacterium]|nr:hypothetical protein [Planctomycetota bacterium]